MSNTQTTNAQYTARDLKAKLNWVQFADLVPFLEKNGILPTSQFKYGKRTYRLYDQAAMDQVSALRKARDEIRTVATKAAKTVSNTPGINSADIRALNDKIDALAAGIAALSDDLRTALDVFKAINDTTSIEG